MMNECHLNQSEISKTWYDGTILSLALIINDDVSLQSLFPFWKLQIIYFVWIQDIVKTGFWSSAGMNLVAFYQSEIRCIFQQITVLGLALKTYLAYVYVDNRSHIVAANSIQK